MLGTCVCSKRRWKIPAYLDVFKKKRDRHIMCPAVVRWRWRRACFEAVAGWDTDFPHSICWIITYVSDNHRRKSMMLIVWPVVEANMTASRMCHGKEGKVLRIIKLKYFLYSNFCKNRETRISTNFQLQCWGGSSADRPKLREQPDEPPQHWIHRLIFLFDRKER